MTDGRIANDRRVDEKRDLFIDLSMRGKQLVASIRQGRRINIQILDEDQVSGYLAGWDADTYLLLEPIPDGFNKLLIPKNNILFIQLLDERTFREEAQHLQMEPIVKPFRELLNKHYPK